MGLKKILKEIFSILIIMSEISNNNLSFEFKRSGRPKGIHTPWAVKKNPDRWLPDGKYSYQPLDPQYFNKYWREHFAKPYTCSICNKTLLCCDKIKRHENTKKCQKARASLTSTQ